MCGSRRASGARGGGRGNGARGGRRSRRLPAAALRPGEERPVSAGRGRAAWPGWKELDYPGGRACRSLARSPSGPPHRAPPGDLGGLAAAPGWAGWGLPWRGDIILSNGPRLKKGLENRVGEPRFHRLLRTTRLWAIKTALKVAANGSGQGGGIPAPGEPWTPAVSPSPGKPGLSYPAPGPFPLAWGRNREALMFLTACANGLLRNDPLSGRASKRPDTGPVHQVHQPHGILRTMENGGRACRLGSQLWPGGGSWFLLALLSLGSCTLS